MATALDSGADSPDGATTAACVRSSACAGACASSRAVRNVAERRTTLHFTLPGAARMGTRCAAARHLSSGPAASASPRYFGAATMGSMALIVFFRGINVGGHRAFRPSVLAKELGIYDAVNVGAAGTLVIRKPGLRAKFLAELRRKLPFEATIAFCDGGDLIQLEMDNPFGTEPPPADVVQFVSILSEAGRRRLSLPIALPEGGEWLVRIMGSKNRLVYGVYRRHMKTIGYLGQIDRLFGAPATTRSWNTILSVLRILKSHEPGK